MDFGMTNQSLGNYISGSSDIYSDWLTNEHRTGTTIMAVEFNGGVVIAADSRTTTGAYIANRVTDKLTKVTDRIYCCRSGSAADTQAITDVVAYHLGILKMEQDEEPQVHVAASVFQEMCYKYRDSLSAGIICAGWDRHKGGQVYILPLGGMCLRQPFAIGGSGSTYIYGQIDRDFKEGMTKEECINFCRTSVALAMSRDGSSGGVIRLAIITKDGVENKLWTGKDVPEFWTKC